MWSVGWRAVLGLVVLVSGLACGTGQVAGAAMARTRDTDPAVVAARAWLDVFSTRDAERLVQITQLPFTFAATDGLGPDGAKRCGAMIGDTGRLERLIGCIGDRAPKLLSELGHSGELKLEPTDRTQLRTSLINLLGPARSEEHLVRAVTGDAAFYFELVLLLVPEESGPRILVAGLALREVMVLE